MTTKRIKCCGGRIASHGRSETSARTMKQESHLREITTRCIVFFAIGSMVDELRPPAVSLPGSWGLSPRCTSRVDSRRCTRRLYPSLESPTLRGGHRVPNAP